MFMGVVLAKHRFAIWLFCSPSFRGTTTRWVHRCMLPRATYATTLASLQATDYGFTGVPLLHESTFLPMESDIRVAEGYFLFAGAPCPLPCWKEGTSYV